MQMKMYYVVYMPRFQSYDCEYLEGPMSYAKAIDKRDDLVLSMTEHAPSEIQVVSKVVTVE